MIVFLTAVVIGFAVAGPIGAVVAAGVVVLELNGG